MPISELVIGSLRPDVAQKGLVAIRTSVPKVFSTVPGSLSNHVGHIIKLNGKDVSSEYKPILGLEWNEASDFHAFYPASEAFQAFVGVFGPYAAAKARPQLFQPSPSSASFLDTFSLGVAQIFIASAAQDKKNDLTGAWDNFLEVLKKEGEFEQWSGWGIEEDEGTWVGIVGWKGVDEIEHRSEHASVSKAVQKLKALSELDEYVVSFT
ncbi:hypothetical protein N0V90_010693 [Kalmusia sp. IMI 367209]|nr:hypothetical protein N0V90_010693 [Kalmusia sp. IMI 367209]